MRDFAGCSLTGYHGRQTLIGIARRLGLVEAADAASRVAGVSPACLAGILPASGEDDLASSRGLDNGTHNAGETPATRETPASQGAGIGAVAAADAALLEAVQLALDVDFRGVGGFPRIESPYAKTVSDTEVVDEFGVRRRWTGLYMDIVHSPLQGATLAELRAFRFPDPATADTAQIDAWALQAKKLREETDYIVVGEHPVYGVLELGCWMCGFDDFLGRLLAEPEFTDCFFEKFYEFQTGMIDVYYSRLGPYIDITTSGDDFGTQNGPFLSPGLFRDKIRPWYERRIALTRRHTRAYFSHHTCGSVLRLLPDLIGMGVDILNPVQPDAFEMDFAVLKERFGRDLVFWGGIDEKNILTRGRPQDVDAAVKHANATLGRDGGYILAPSHNIQHDVPPENVLAMYGKC